MSAPAHPKSVNKLSPLSHDNLPQHFAITNPSWFMLHIHSPPTVCRPYIIHTWQTNKTPKCTSQQPHTHTHTHTLMLVSSQHGNADGWHCWDDLMAVPAPMEPDINPKNTDRHATTYSTDNTTSSLNKLLLSPPESSPPTVTISTMSMQTNTLGYSILHEICRTKKENCTFSEKYKREEWSLQLVLCSKQDVNSYNPLPWNVI